FAGNGEEEPLTALQGNDKRLKKATTESHGIVELAQSGENKEGVVVQGNDQRLRPAEFDEAGIVMLSRPGVDSSGKVVTADDPRLSDKREPKEHSHPYSPVNHDFNSHSGLIRLSGSTESEFKNIVAPPQNHSVIFGKNENEKGAGIAGVGGSEGLLGFANKFGVSGYSKGTTDESAGILGVSDNGYGGIFSSQKNYAMTAVGSGIKEKDIVGSGKAILAIGDSLFRGSLRISEANGQDCIARYFALAKGDVISPGDLVVLSGEEGKVAKSKNSYSTKVAGVAVKSASLELGEKKSSDVLLVALSGIVNLNVDASDGEVSPGDLLVAGLSAGYAIKADPAKLKPGMLVGKALGSCKKGKLLIPVLICLQ
ncbi:MAG: carbohydrate-binding protein, partial [Leptospira sp.]|nr:carbohydrate-binding protein [Leptospira sp.]